ncbi:hypothetical protein PR003_g25554 [Phytophthora rubi]|uniref:RxLR effector protein n=1 Tax=Phytophthora rubi TaxID=129364 RepID=A0A6A4CE71_9STRA|nr:hypothetical protein PR001_g28501 [Phytophthora rubi]KAE8980376.1 hypothetical protein PR002_g24151 [Phytophthora rubi]KAE9289460.1 hypothetical protein PR003_g25554 [Phytophthora rubi]
MTFRVVLLWAMIVINHCSFRARKGDGLACSARKTLMQNSALHLTALYINGVPNQRGLRTRRCSIYKP